MSEKGKMLTTTINIMGQIDPSLQKTIADTQKRIKKLAPALAAATAGALAMKGAFSLVSSVTGKAGRASAFFHRRIVESSAGQLSPPPIWTSRIVSAS